MTSSEPHVKQQIHQSTIDLLRTVRTDESIGPFLKAYTAFAEVNALLFESTKQESLKKNVLENSLIILSSIAES